MANLADFLMDLSTQLIQSLNDRQFREVTNKLMIPEFGGFHAMDQTEWSLTTREDVVLQIEEFLDENPNFQTEILDISADTDPVKHTAQVWIRRTDRGLAEGPNRETLMQLSWVLRDGTWLCDGYQGVRSFPHYGGAEDLGGGGLGQSSSST